MFNNELFAQKMEELGYNTYSLADKLVVSQAMVESIKKGYRIPSLPLAVRIAQLFGCTVDDLVKGGVSSG